MKVLKKLFLSFLIIILLIVSFIVANTVYQMLPHHIVNVEEIKELNTELEDFPIESCDCYWQADVVFMGGALESHSSGKLTLSDEFYKKLLKEYEWAEATGMPCSESNCFLDINGFACDSFKEFVKGTYLVSDSFQQEFYSVIILSKDDNVMYFFRRDF